MMLKDLRVMAHEIAWDDKLHPLSIAEISSDRKHITIKPFKQEEAATPFYNGRITAVRDSKGELWFSR